MARFARKAAWRAKKPVRFPHCLPFEVGGGACRGGGGGGSCGFVASVVVCSWGPVSATRIRIAGSRTSTRGLFLAGTCAPFHSAGPSSMTMSSSTAVPAAAPPPSASTFLLLPDAADGIVCVIVAVALIASACAVASVVPAVGEKQLAVSFASTIRSLLCCVASLASRRVAVAACRVSWCGETMVCAELQPGYRDR